MKPIFIPSDVFLSPFEKAEAARHALLNKNIQSPYDKELSLHPVYYGTWWGLDCVFSEKPDFSGKDIIDGGAYKGDSAMFFSELSPRTIHAFEPSKITIDILHNNIRKYHKEKIIIPVNKAIGEKECTLEFYSYGEDSMGATIIPDMTRNIIEKIECITIDKYVEENHLDVGLIKLDLEGAECGAIQAATETIKKFKPILIVGLYHTPKDFFEIKPYLESLELGYKFFVRQMPYSCVAITARHELIAYVPR
jgi:FkbM family methyltransferase